ncbi:FIST N-terminal domain-containing protein [Alkalimonas mucilaginosa]|uniref:FIST N-terminal domain-containing protein n=1 Tax=Alkalimonas mucilaginosa TaxID=3057676 RepID=A0ABU7JDN4_9GAMM|nr:FIST N-terminal domain-containing protein [Alkalimonas sp. MEB004]MEE2023801.1 FIST N-terminal domain-containing protein [Alkalimonas sp. MEB004]
MNIGLGYSCQASSLHAGQEAANLAGQLQQHPELILAFCNHQLNPHDVYLGIRAEVGDQVPIIGGSVIGIIGNDFVQTDGPAVLVAALRSDQLRCHYASSKALFKDAKLSGIALGNQLSSIADPSCLLLLYDSIKHPATKQCPAVLNPSNLLLQGLAESQLNVSTIIGAGLLGDHSFQRCWQFTGFGVNQQEALGLLLSGPLHSHTTVLHGCHPVADTEYTISNIHGQFLYALDNQPAVQVIEQALGTSEWRQSSPVHTVCLGRKITDPDSGQTHYINRLISGLLPENDGLILFEDDYQLGDKVLLMHHDPAAMLSSVGEKTSTLLRQIQQSGQKPLFALYINCGGRIELGQPNERAETLEIQRQLTAAGIPLLGFYSGVEIAPVLGKPRGLDWSGVLTIICRPG